MNLAKIVLNCPGLSALIPGGRGLSGVSRKCSNTILPPCRSDVSSFSTNIGSVTGAHAKVSTIRSHFASPKSKVSGDADTKEVGKGTVPLLR